MKAVKNGPIAAFRDWQGEFSKTVEGLLFFSNVASDISKKRIPKSLLRQFQLTLGHARLVPTSKQEPADLLAASLKANRNVFFCQGRPYIPEGTGCSRLMDARTFAIYNLEKAPFGLEEDEFLPLEVLNSLEEKGIPSNVPKSTMSNPHGFAWVTQTDHLKGLRAVAPSGDLANRFRDDLGLRHYGADHYLIEVTYPPRLFHIQSLFPPTAFDGFANFAFRSGARSDGWGVAVHLKTMGDGGPEAIHWAIPFSHHFSIRMVGVPTNNCYTVPEEFHHAHPTPCTGDHDRPRPRSK